MRDFREIIGFPLAAKTEYNDVVVTGPQALGWPVCHRHGLSCQKRAIGWA
jgi:hypothetical protein